MDQPWLRSDDVDWDMERVVSMQRLSPQLINSAPAATLCCAASAGSLDPGGARGCLPEMAGSADPAVVFSAVVGSLAPSLCDSAFVEVTQAEMPATDTDVRTAAVAQQLWAFPPSDVTSPDGLRVVMDTSPGLPGCTRRSIGCNRFTASFRISCGDPIQPGSYTARVTCGWRAGCPGTERLQVLEMHCRQAAHLVSHARYRAALSEQENLVRNLQRALVSNRTIAAACGVLMSSRHLTYDQAFDLLVSISQLTNRKVAALAEDVLYAGGLTS